MSNKTKKKSLASLVADLTSGRVDLALFSRNPFEYLQNNNYDTGDLSKIWFPISPDSLVNIRSVKDLKNFFLNYSSEEAAVISGDESARVTSNQVSQPHEARESSSVDEQQPYIATRPELSPGLVLHKTLDEPVESFNEFKAEPAVASAYMPFPEFRKSFEQRTASFMNRRKKESAELTDSKAKTIGPILDNLLDASLARETVAQRMLLGESPAPEGMIQESILLQDDRVQVTDTTSFPYRWLCRIEITAASGARWLGTGWFAAPGLIVTAGHCVYLHNHGGWVSQVVVHVGQNGGYVQRSIISNYFASSRGWVYERDAMHDYGVIFVPGIDEGHFGYGVFSDSSLSGVLANISGYPQDKPPGTLWGHAKHLLPPKIGILRYEIDTFGGMSGAPVALWDGQDYIVAGIHNYGDVTGNIASRITPEIYNNLERWKSI